MDTCQAALWLTDSAVTAPSVPRNGAWPFDTEGRWQCTAPIACQVNANARQHLPPAPRLWHCLPLHAHTSQSSTWAQVHLARAPETESGSAPSPLRCSLWPRCAAEDVAGKQGRSFVPGDLSTAPSSRCPGLSSLSAPFRQFGESEHAVNLCFPSTEWLHGDAEPEPEDGDPGTALTAEEAARRLLPRVHHAPVAAAALLLGQALPVPGPPRRGALPGLPLCHVLVLPPPRLAARQSGVKREPCDLHFPRIPFYEKRDQPQLSAEHLERNGPANAEASSCHQPQRHRPVAARSDGAGEHAQCQREPLQRQGHRTPTCSPLQVSHQRACQVPGEEPVPSPANRCGAGANRGQESDSANVGQRESSPRHPHHTDFSVGRSKYSFKWLLSTRNTGREQTTSRHNPTGLFRYILQPDH